MALTDQQLITLCSTKKPAWVYTSERDSIYLTLGDLVRIIQLVQTGKIK